jgi:arylsulfatase A-like enzyme
MPGWTDATPPHDVEFSAGYFRNADLTLPALRRVMAYYYATLSQIDFHVGRMIERLKRRGLYENTLIIFTSDHGDFMGHHHMILKGGLMYDPLVKVPLIIKWPAGAGQGRAAGAAPPARGSASDALVSNVDVAPTILKQAGCPVPPTMRGLDLAGNERRDVVFCEVSGYRQLMARTAAHKLILRDAREKSLFFDLGADPLEMNNLYGRPEQAAEIARLTKAVEEWRGPPAAPPNYLDENAPVIGRPNVPRRDDNHRQEMIAYFQQKMAQGR